MRKDSIPSVDALIIRNLDSTIRYWSDGAKKLYGWGPHDALEATSQQLLKTVFPVPLRVIEEELRTKGRWEGQLVQVLRDGSRVTVVSHWVTEQPPHSQDGSMKVIEVNSPLNASSGSFRDELLSLLNQPRYFNRQPACQTVS